MLFNESTTTGVSGNGPSMACRSRRIVSASLLSQLFSGNMYPHLKDREGRPFDWELIPRATRGRRPSGRNKKAELNDLRRQINHVSLVLRTVCDRMGLSGELDPFDIPDDPSTHDRDDDKPVARKPKYVDDILVEDDADLAETPSPTPPPDDEDDDNEPVNTIPQPTVPPPRRS